MKLQADDPAFIHVPAKLKQELTFWESYLCGGEYLCGDAFTLADVAVGPLLLSLERQGATFGGFPGLAAYIGVLKVSKPSTRQCSSMHAATKKALCMHLPKEILANRSCKA